MLLPSCGDSVTVLGDGSLACSSGWVMIDYSPLLPPIDSADATELILATIAAWAAAVAIVILIRTVRGRS